MVGVQRLVWEARLCILEIRLHPSRGRNTVKVFWPLGFIHSDLGRWGFYPFAKQVQLRMNPSCCHQDHEGEEYRSFTHSEEDNYPLHEICMLRRVSSVCLEHRRGEERRSLIRLIRTMGAYPCTIWCKIPSEPFIAFALRGRNTERFR